MSEEVKLCIFIVAAVFAASGLGLWFFYIPIKRFFWRHNRSRMFYNRVMKVARNGDYYLLNKLNLSVGEHDYVTIDHLLGGDKFIYVITDCYYEGALTVKPSDPTWVHYKSEDKKETVSNPLRENYFAVQRLSMVSGINASFLVGIVLLNDDCFVTSYANSEGDVLLVPLSRLEKVVTAYERKDVEPFVKKELWQIIHDLHDLNQKGENGKKNE
jgi:hypothetical protein